MFASFEMKHTRQMVEKCNSGSHKSIIDTSSFLPASLQTHSIMLPLPLMLACWQWLPLPAGPLKSLCLPWVVSAEGSEPPAFCLTVIIIPPGRVSGLWHRSKAQCSSVCLFEETVETFLLRWSIPKKNGRKGSKMRCVYEQVPQAWRHSVTVQQNLQRTEAGVVGCVSKHQTVTGETTADNGLTHLNLNLRRVRRHVFILQQSSMLVLEQRGTKYFPLKPAQVRGWWLSAN